MIVSEEARAARKDSQLARLAAKADEEVDYPTFYANQPLQQAKAKLNDQIRQGRVLERQAHKDMEVARATGINIEVAEAAVRDAAAAIAGLRAIKQQRFKRGVSASVTGGES